MATEENANESSIIADDLFTRKECERILDKVLCTTAKGHLLEFSVVPELNTIGYLGEYFYLKLCYVTSPGDGEIVAEQQQQPHHIKLFVKTMPFKNVDLVNYFEKWGILKKEATLYATLLAELKKFSRTFWCASCYYIKDNLFVLQNLADCNYEYLRGNDFLGPDHIRSVLRGLAAIHASSIGYEVRNGVSIGEKFKDFLFEITVSPIVDWYTVGIKAVEAIALQHPLYQSADHQDFIRNKLIGRLECVYDMVNPSEKYPNVFCHRDPWGGNVFFSRDNLMESAVFVDFQTCRYSPPATDVLFALYLSIRPRDRKLVMTDHIRWYYKCFAMELQAMGIDANDHMSLQLFEESCEAFKLFGALYNCIAATIIRVPGDFLRDMKHNRPQDFNKYAYVDRSEGMLQLINTDQAFREYMFEVVEDMLEVAMGTTNG